MPEKYNMNNPSIKRIMREIKEMEQETSTQFRAKPLEENLFEWHFTIRGPPDTPFEGGIYHGRISLPPDYPFKPPNIILLTPNGRFEVGKKICLSISAHHPEQWQPSWSIRTVLLALIGFMPTKGEGAIGAIDYTAEERKDLARKSKSWVCDVCGKPTLPEPSPDEPAAASSASSSSSAPSAPGASALGTSPAFVPASSAPIDIKPRKREDESPDGSPATSFGAQPLSPSAINFYYPPPSPSPTPTPIPAVSQSPTPPPVASSSSPAPPKPAAVDEPAPSSSSSAGPQSSAVEPKPRALDSAVPPAASGVPPPVAPASAAGAAAPASSGGPGASPAAVRRAQVPRPPPAAQHHDGQGTSLIDYIIKALVVLIIALVLKKVSRMYSGEVS